MNLANPLITVACSVGRPSGQKSGFFQQLLDLGWQKKTSKSWMSCKSGMTSTATSTQSLMSESPAGNHPNAFWLPALSFFPQGNVNGSCVTGSTLVENQPQFRFVQVTVLNPPQSSLVLCSSFQRPKSCFGLYPKMEKSLLLLFSCLDSRENKTNFLNLTVSLKCGTKIFPI